jgi:mono/diheme cytochrome c family protein
MMPTHGPQKKSRTLYFIAMFAIVVAGSIALVYGVSNWAAEQKAKKMPNPIPPTQENVRAGMKTYQDHCVQCHGDKGDGKGQKSAQLSVEPGNFTDQRRMRDLTDGLLYWQISKGRDPMPGFEDKLTPVERWRVVDYIRGFIQTPNAAGSQSPAASTQSQQPN